MMQFTINCPTHGAMFNFSGAWILSLAEEDGELKILQVKEFTDPQDHIAFDSAHAAAKGAPASLTHPQSVVV
jgi:hypothetical protein